MEQHDKEELAFADEHRAAFRRQFGIALLNLDHVEMYWSPSTRRIHARAPAARRRFKLPADAVFVGAYAHPFNLTAFLGDLNDVLAQLEHTKHAAATAALELVTDLDRIDART